MRFWLSVVLVLSGALAQQEAPALKLLDAALKAHGGAALASLRTYQETAELTTYTDGQVSTQLQVVSSVDFLSGKMRLEYRDGRTLIQVIQVTRSGGQSWSEQTGTHSLAPELAKDVQDGFYQTWYGLRLGGKNRQMAKLEGLKSFADAKGRAVSLKSFGVTTTYLFDPQNQLVGERYRNSQGLLSIRYSDLRTVGGIRIPFEASIYADGFLFAQTKVSQALVNPTLGADAFKMP